jgi:hypothetical protein
MSETVPPRPPFWRRLTVVQGSLIQVAGIAAGVVLLAFAVQASSAIAQVGLLLLGWLAIYICSHAIAHYAVGRLVGIRFAAFGIRGSDHPYDYPPILGLRRIMVYFPTFTAITDKDSMRAARPLAKAAMFAAGETSTSLCSIAVGVYAWQNGIPGGAVFLALMIVFSIAVTYVTATTPRGDYAKARKALKG